MIATTHIAFAACAGGVASVFMPGEHSYLIVGITSMVGSLLPDIDHPKSFFGSRIRPVSDLVAAIFGHRGITHSALAVIAILFYCYIRSGQMSDWVVGLTVGYLSHLVGDWLTPSGIPFLWPKKQKYKAPLTFRTGGLGEHVFLIAMVFSAWACVLKMN